MAGLYIHIPFCVSRCIYCGFYSTTNHALKDGYVDALCHEIEMRKDYLKEDIRTIYIGGGTPSTLGGQQLQRIFSHINSDNAVEITMECNPDDITPEYVTQLRGLPINRISMGVQTFDDKRLAFLRRRHKSANVKQAINALRHVGIRNISIDLMYGFPGETIEQWIKDIDEAVNMGVEHISAYSLMFEEGTPLYCMLEKGGIKEIDEELSLLMYETLIDRLAEAGYEHYEISNFAKPGFRSRHNSSYWTDIPYIGIGASAHSYDNTSRQWNVSDISTYITEINRGNIPAERETLDIDTRYNDTVMLRLRTSEGININEIKNVFGSKYSGRCIKTAQRHIENGLIVLENGHLHLSRKGLFVSDMIMSDFMIV